MTTVYAEARVDASTVHIPWAVEVYHSGWYKDDDGVEWRDSPPSYDIASGHLTRKGAEEAAAWLEHNGIEAARITIREGAVVENWELKHIGPIGD